MFMRVFENRGDGDSGLTPWFSGPLARHWFSVNPLPLAKRPQTDEPDLPLHLRRMPAEQENSRFQLDALR
jgi:hypothetical protein